VGKTSLNAAQPYAKAEGRGFLLVLAYPGCPGTKAVKWLLLLLLLNTYGALKPREQKRSHFLLVFHRRLGISVHQPMLAYMQQTLANISRNFHIKRHCTLLVIDDLPEKTRTNSIQCQIWFDSVHPIGSHFLLYLYCLINVLWTLLRANLNYTNFS